MEMTKTQQWITILEVMSKYHSNVKIIGDLLNKLQQGHISNLTPAQEKTLNNIYDQSWHIKKINADLDNIKKAKETDTFTKAMNKKWQETQSKPQPNKVYLPNTPAEVVKYNEQGEVERRPIGFKTQVNNISTSPIQMEGGRYHLDTSIQNIKQTRLERFDAIFND